VTFTTQHEMNKRMDRGDGMRALRSEEQRRWGKDITAVSPQMRGVVGWMLSLLRGWRDQREGQRRLRLVETLPLGGKRELMLVMCAGESFLVGGGPESVQTIVRLKGEISDTISTGLDELCR
jgi:hypothetical protein